MLIYFGRLHEWFSVFPESVFSFQRIIGTQIIGFLFFGANSRNFIRKATPGVRFTYEIVAKISIPTLKELRL